MEENNKFTKEDLTIKRDLNRYHRVCKLQNLAVNKSKLNEKKGFR